MFRSENILEDKVEKVLKSHKMMGFRHEIPTG